MGSPVATGGHPGALPKRSPFVRSDHQAKSRIDPAISPGLALRPDRMKRFALERGNVEDGSQVFDGKLSQLPTASGLVGKA
jgi:hypothetical protein